MGMPNIGLGLNGSLGLQLQGSLGESSGWQNGSGGGSGYNWGQGSTFSDTYGESWNNSVQNAYNRVYGTEASKADISNAKEANQEARDMWALQADYNAKEAQINRDYQTAMSNTAYQRAVKDLQSAGLNPILAVGGGMQASSPMGATAVSGLSSAHKAQTFADQIGYSSGNSSGGSYNRGHSEGQSASYGQNSSWWATEGGSYGWTGNNVAAAAETLGGMVKQSFESLQDWAKDAVSGIKDTPLYQQAQTFNNSGRGRQAINTATSLVKQTVSTAKTLANTLSKTTNKSFVSNAVKSAQKKR